MSRKDISCKREEAQTRGEKRRNANHGTRAGFLNWREGRGGGQRCAEDVRKEGEDGGMKDPRISWCFRGRGGAHFANKKE